MEWTRRRKAGRGIWDLGLCIRDLGGLRKECVVFTSTLVIKFSIRDRGRGSRILIAYAQDGRDCRVGGRLGLGIWILHLGFMGG